MKAPITEHSKRLIQENARKWNNKRRALGITKVQTLRGLTNEIDFLKNGINSLENKYGSNMVRRTLFLVEFYRKNKNKQGIEFPTQKKIQEEIEVFANSMKELENTKNNKK